MTDLFLQHLLGAFRWRQPRKVNENHERQKGRDTNGDGMVFHGSLVAPEQDRFELWIAIEQLDMQNHHRVMRDVICHARKDAAGLHREITEDHADDRGDDRLLQNLVRDPEKHCAQHDRPPAVAQMPQAGKDEPAERQLLANRRRHGDQQQDDTDRRVGEPRELLA